MGIRYDFDLHFAELDARVDAAVPDALMMGAEHIGEKSAPLVPLEEGTLLRSWQVDVSEDEAEMSYNTPYARYQHEVLSLRHPHGQAKFLEQPMLTDGPQAVEIVGEQIRRAL
jgi:hypothetical protein